MPAEPEVTKAVSTFSSSVLSALIPWIVFFGIVAIVLEFIRGLFKWKTPHWTGRRGERYVNKKLFELDPAQYKSLDDLLLPSQGNLKNTQIDHVVVSNYGIFCIETKSYKGWIFGSANQDSWTQVIYHRKERFYNPLRQNYAHKKAIEALILSKFPKARVISFIAFPYAERLKISGTDAVGHTFEIVKKIEGYTTPILSDFEREEIYRILADANIKDAEIRKLHDRGVRDLKRY